MDKLISLHQNVKKQLVQGIQDYLLVAEKDWLMLKLPVQVSNSDWEVFEVSSDFARAKWDGEKTLESLFDLDSDTLMRIIKQLSKQIK